MHKEHDKIIALLKNLADKYMFYFCLLTESCDSTNIVFKFSAAQFKEGCQHLDKLLKLGYEDGCPLLFDTFRKMDAKASKKFKKKSPQKPDSSKDFCLFVEVSGNKHALWVSL